MCYYFSKRSTNILASKKKWILFLRIFLIIVLIYMVIGLFWLIILESENKLDNNLLCETYIFLLVRIGGEIITLTFLIIGIVINLKVNKLIKNRLIDKAMIDNYKWSLKKLW